MVSASSSSALTILTLFVIVTDSAQSVLKPKGEIFENILSIPKDPSDPSSWDYDWSFSGIRYNSLGTY
jgi:hypothetical protein